MIELLSTVDEPVHGATIKMDILRNPLVDESQKEIKRGFNRIKEFQSFCVEDWNMTSIPSGKMKTLSEYVFKAKSQAIQRMPKKANSPFSSIYL